MYGINSNVAISDLSPGSFLANDYKLGIESFDLKLVPKLKQVKEMLKDEDLFKTPESTSTFFGLTKTLYENICSELEQAILNSYRGNYTNRVNRRKGPKDTSGMVNIIYNAILEKSLIEPSTKMFLEDLYSIIYRNNKNCTITQYGYILGTGMATYKIGKTGFSIQLEEMTETNRGSRLLPIDKELPTLIKRVGYRATISVIEILIGIYLSLWFSHRPGQLNDYLTTYPSTLWAIGDL